MKGRIRFGVRIFQAANEPFDQIVKRAKFCEKHGFDSVLVDDHLLYGTEAAAAPEPFRVGVDRLDRRGRAVAEASRGTHRSRSFGTTAREERNRAMASSYS